MNLLATVQRQNHVAHLLVGKVDHVLVDEHPVGGEGEAEVFVVLFLDGAGVGHQILYHLKVHQRLAAEEVHFQVVACAGILDKEIQSPLAHLKGHDRPIAVIFPLTGEAIGAVEVAGVGHMKAKSLDHPCGFVFQFSRHIGEGVGGKEHALVLQFRNLIIAFLDLRGGNFGDMGVFFADFGKNRFFRFLLKKGDDVIGHVVHRMHRAGADVENNVVAVELVLMDHMETPLGM